MEFRQRKRCEKNTATYGRFDQAARIIDPREE